MAEGSEKVAMTDLLVIAYPPIKRVIKLEIPDEQEEANEENRAFQQPKESVVMADPSMTAYLPLQFIIKQEMSDEHQEDCGEEDNRKLHHSEDSSPKMAQNLDSKEEQDGNLDEGCERSEHSSLEDFDESVNSFADSTIQDGADEADQESQTSKQPSSLQDIQESVKSSLTAAPIDDEESLVDITSPKAGPCGQPTRLHESSNQTAPIEKGSFNCNKCERVYKKKCSLTYHLKYECGVEPHFRCTLCDTQFKRNHNLQRHLILVHQVDRKKLDKYRTGLKDRPVLPFKCNKCERSFKRKRTLVQHMNHECGVAFNCPECKQNLTSKRSLQGHLLGIHKIDRNQLDKFGAGYKVRTTQPYKCDQCDRTYKLQGSLTQHMKTCGVEPSLLCPQCDYRSKRKFDLKLHLLEMHNVERSQLTTFGLGPVIREGNQFKCDLCGRCYKNKQNLKQHLIQKCGK